MHTIVSSGGSGHFASPLRIGLAAALVGLAVGCSRQDSGQPQPSAAPSQPPAAPLLTSLPAPVSAPHVGGPAGYVGSAACRECHAEEHASWHQSYHRTMTQLPSAEAIRADFDRVLLTNENTRFTLSRTNDEFWVRMERTLGHVDGQLAEASLDTRISLVTGSHHMQVFWVSGEQGNAQLGFPFTWLIPEQRWVPRKSTFIRPPDAPHLSEIWNFTCSRCHTTAIEPRIDRVRRTADTRVAELGIACEACHGPGERHVRAREAERGQAEPSAEALAKEIVHPKKIDPARASQVCGFCHSMKWFDQAEDWRTAGFHYRPGDDLEQTTPIIRPGRLQSIPGLTAYLERQPELLRDYFWSDGMVRVSGRDYNGLLESPCYKGGHFSCLSCHSLHRSDPAGQLARNRTGDAACTQCHTEFNEPSRRLAHTHHAPDSPGSECYNCHMPRTTYGVLKAIRSHQISNPRVADQLGTGRPNACNLCHLDKPLVWTARYLTEWYHQPTPDLTPDQRQLADGVRLALSGDAGQRALIAWHLGWEPARRTAGDAWIPPVLAQLLDDPYAAVRCMAERSLRQFGGLVPPGYDFSHQPDARGPAALAVVERWLTLAQVDTNLQAALPAETLVTRGEGRAVLQPFERLKAQRDERPMRLRE